MKRLFATIRIDIRLQYRNGFYFAAAFVAIISVFVLRWLALSNLGYLLPALVFSNLLINTFYFISGLILLEKGEGTLEAQIITPMRSWEYLASKVITLSLLAIMENFFIVIFAFGFNFDFFLLAIGLLLVSIIYCLFGFIVVIRYESINEFLFPSFIYTLVLPLPMLYYFEIWQHAVYYLHPVFAPFLLLAAAFQPIEIWQGIYGLLYSFLWIGILFYFSQRAFYRFVIVK